jgi:hypothetical protein
MRIAPLAPAAQVGADIATANCRSSVSRGAQRPLQRKEQPRPSLIGATSGIEMAAIAIAAAHAFGITLGPGLQRDLH